MHYHLWKIASHHQGRPIPGNMVKGSPSGSKKRGSKKRGSSNNRRWKRSKGTRTSAAVRKTSAAVGTTSVAVSKTPASGTEAKLEDQRNSRTATVPKQTSGNYSGKKSKEGTPKSFKI